jgi:UDP-perosamine 4-acetyltransferase
MRVARSEPVGAGKSRVSESRAGAGSVVVIGGGGHAKVVIDVLQQQGWQVAGYTDPAPLAGSQICGAPWLGDDDTLERLRAEGIAWAIAAFGDNARRSRMADRALALGFELANAVHPSAQISPHARLGQGVAVMPGVAVNAGSVIGDSTVLNTASSVDHDCTLGRGVHVAPGAHLAGYIVVDDEALIGGGAIIGRGKPIRIGRGAVVGAGAVVIHDVPPATTVAGNPARPLRPAAVAAAVRARGRRPAR